MTTEAIDWISEVRDQPFFAYVPYYTVHTPLETIDTFKQKYLSHPKVRNERHATYAAMVELMDINIGRLITSLKEFNISNDTLIIFTSDNGGIRSISYQDPLRGGKGSYYEGGTRVPLLIHWQNKIPAKEVNIPVINADFFPTLASVLGKIEFRYPLDGIDLSPLLLSNLSIEERSLFWHFPIYLQSYNPSADQSRDPLFRTRPGSTMRKGKWKLHHYFEDDSYELYDLENDEGEHVNLAQYLPKIVQALSAELQHWQDSINAPIPKTANPQFDEVFSAELTEKHLSKK
ncbi:sulfatase-like hydrolase/transferase [Alteromonas sp. KUL17]|uniref:sulfatase-like hydrolase/transferase n=1 Tax=Alteromonas sp. KUL17 TaxID=2480796 RepID=UPI003241E52A